MNAFEDQLIENVKKYPILYRSKQKNYRNIMCKHKCWMEIASVLKITPDECKAKWRNIRDSYNKHVKKKKTGINSTAISKYDDEKLNFLSERYGAIETLNIDYSASSDNSFEDEKKDDPLDDDFSETSLPDPEVKSDIKVHPVQPTAANVTFINDSEEDLTPRKKRKTDTIKEVQKPTDEKNIIIQEILGGASRREGSPTHNFFSSMADIVCKFPVEKIAETRMKVCSLVSEMEIQILRDGSQSSSRR